MSRSRFCLLAASLAAMLAFTIVVTGGETVVAAADAGRDVSRGPSGRPALGPPQAVAAKPPPQAAPPGEYVGEETCLGCHDDKGYKGTKHGLTLNQRTPAATHGCESCHGPGKAHAESGDPGLIRNPKKLKPQEASQICATCHNRNT